MVNEKKYKDLNDFEDKFIINTYKTMGKDLSKENAIALFFRKIKLKFIFNYSENGINGVISLTVKPKFIEIDSIFIEENVRKQGFGKNLVQEVMKIDQYKDIKVVLNKRNDHFDSYSKFFKSLGFEFLEYQGKEGIVFLRKAGN